MTIVPLIFAHALCALPVALVRPTRRRLLASKAQLRIAHGASYGALKHAQKNFADAERAHNNRLYSTCSVSLLLFIILQLTLA